MCILEIALLRSIAGPHGRSVERWQLGLAGVFPAAFCVAFCLMQFRLGRERVGSFALLMRVQAFILALATVLIFGVFYTKFVFKWW